MDDKWTNTVANKFTSQADSIIPFCMAVLTCIGMFFAMIYTVKEKQYMDNISIHYIYVIQYI